MIEIFALPLALLFGCSSNNAAQQASADVVEDTVETYSLNNIDFSLANDFCQKQKEILALTKAERICADKVNDLAFSMFHQMAKEQMDSSFVVSPMSLNCAIAMAGNGASGKTLQEIERLVGPIADANSFFEKYHAALPHNDYSKCDILNFLAVNPKYPIKEAFTKSMATREYGLRALEEMKKPTLIIVYGPERKVIGLNTPLMFIQDQITKYHRNGRSEII